MTKASKFLAQELEKFLQFLYDTQAFDLAGSDGLVDLANVDFGKLTQEYLKARATYWNYFESGKYKDRYGLEHFNVLIWRCPKCGFENSTIKPPIKCKHCGFTMKETEDDWK